MRVFSPILPVRNLNHRMPGSQKTLLETTLDAVLRQTARPLDVVIADLGSTDGTLEEVAKYQSIVNSQTEEQVTIRVILASTRLQGVHTATALNYSALYTVVEPSEIPDPELGKYFCHVLEDEGPLAVATTEDGQVAFTGEAFLVVLSDLGCASRDEIAQASESRSLPVTQVAALSDVTGDAQGSSL